MVTLDLQKLSEEERINLATETNSPELLTELSKDKNYCVRTAVANNIITPRTVLAKLSKDENLEVRLGVAGNTHTSRAILLKLSLLGDCDVKYVAYNTLEMLG